MTTTRDSVIAHLADAQNAQREADETLYDALLVAREGWLTWAEIGELLGVTKQAAQQRFIRLQKQVAGVEVDAETLDYYDTISRR